MSAAAVILISMIFLPEATVAQKAADSRIHPPDSVSRERIATSVQIPAFGPKAMSVEAPPPDTIGVSVGRLLAGGLVGGAAGLLAGLYIGDSGNTDDLGVVFAWGLAVESLALPLGVHLANHRSGSLAKAAITSVTLGLAAGVVTYNTDQAVSVPLFMVAQLIAAVVIEHRTSVRAK